MVKQEHEKLKEICDLIWFEYNDKWNFDIEDFYISTLDKKIKKWEYTTYLIDRDTREIIFTPEFSNKMLDYLEKNQSLENKMTYALWLMNNLYNPVQYLYNLLELWTKQEKK